jgi:hypothetical protein
VPMVWRSDTCVEVGYPPRAVRIEGADPRQVAWLAGLRGERTLEAAIADGQSIGLTRATMRRLVAAGVQAGLIDDAASIPETLRDSAPSLRTMLEGDICSTRHVHGDTSRARDIIDRRRRSEVAIDGDSAHADALALVLTTAGIGGVVRSAPTHSSSRSHRRHAAQRACHVICNAAHPDAAADPDAMALDIPHLSLTAVGARCVIGPLVIPGRTSCLRCRDLHLADADPDWPRIAVQWARRRPAAVAAGLAHLAGAWGALQVLALVDAGPEQVQVPTLDAALVIDLPGAQAERIARPPHPLCGCRWPRTGAGQGPSAA